MRLELYSPLALLLEKLALHNAAISTEASALHPWLLLLVHIHLIARFLSPN